MSTFNAFYIRANEKATLASVREGFDKLAVEQHRDFIGVLLPETASQAPEPMLARLSVMFDTDVIWLSFQSAMDCFAYHHWRAGDHIRSLVFGVYGEERTWDRADGTPEPWERDALFHPKQLPFALENAENDEQRQSIERIYREALVEPGQTEPSLYAKGCAVAIATYYGFPHYGLT